jgi:hypothetical protein
MNCLCLNDKRHLMLYFNNHWSMTIIIVDHLKQSLPIQLNMTTKRYIIIMFVNNIDNMFVKNF